MDSTLTNPIGWLSNTQVSTLKNTRTKTSAQPLCTRCLGDNFPHLALVGRVIRIMSLKNNVKNNNNGDDVQYIVV